MKQRVAAVVCVIAFSGLVTACKEQTISGPGFLCDVTNPVRDVFISPSNATVLIRSPARSTDVIQLKATATNRAGNIRTDVPFTFSSSDATIATVDSTGLVHAIKPGTVTIKASTCGESATTQVTVVNTVVSVQVAPAVQTAVAGDSILVIARAIGQTGASLPDVKFIFTLSPTASGTIKVVNDSTAYVFPTSPGNLTVTASGEGSSASSVISVLAKVFLAGAATAGAIDAGGNYACGLITLGRGYCWGLNDNSQLGAPTDSVCFPEIIPFADSLQAAPRTCSLLPLRIAPLLSFSTVSAGDSTACAIATTGRAYCWGLDDAGQVGDGSVGTRPTPTLVTSALSFTTVTVGGHHSCGLAIGGGAYCWGLDSSSQLGDARHVKSTTPIPVSSGGQSALILSSISAGGLHTCGVAADGTALCWGNNDLGQIGAGGIGGNAETPAGVATALRFTSISAGGQHTCAIAVGGAAYCWGSNITGQLGTGAVGGASAAPVAVSGGLTFSRISSGFHHTCGLTTGGAVFCWGENGDLQLGRGPVTGGDVPSGTPTQVGGGQLPGGVTFTAISAGTNHTCGVGSDGFAYCWGSNVFGALGNTLQAAFRGFPQRVATPQ